MSTNTLPIVGAYFRPPAQSILDSLGIGTPLTLMAEPENPADPNAIAVFLKSSDVPETSYVTLEENLSKSGHDLETFMAQEWWQLGYIPRTAATPLREQGFCNDPVTVEFSLSINGKPRVRSAEPFNV